MRLDTTLGLASDRKDVVRLPLKASIKGAFVDATIADGRLVLGDAPHILAAQAEVQSAGLRQLAGWLGGPWPGERGLGAFKAKGQLEWRDRTVTFQNASFQMDGNDATGTLTLDWGKARPSIEGTLALKQFDLTRYLGTEEKSKAGFLQRTALGWLRSVSEPGSLALPLIRHLDADVRISANEVTGGPVRLGRSAASVAVRDAKMLADLAEVEIEGDGSLRGQLTVDMGGVVPRYVMRGRLEGIDAALLTGYLLGHPAISGRASVVVDLNGTGETADQLASTLYGKLGIELPDGGALGLDVLQLMSLAQRSPELKGWGPPGKGQIRVTSLVSRFGVQSGVLLAETFKATAGDRLFTLSGDINLAARSIDAQLSLARITSTGPLAGSLTGDPLDVLSVRGPWREPSVLYSTRPGKAATPTPLPPAMPAVARQPG
jgi:AsmA protein